MLRHFLHVHNTQGLSIEHAWACLHVQFWISSRTYAVIAQLLELFLSECFETITYAIRGLMSVWYMRRITISTVGIPNSIKQLASRGLQATLAISLHAPDQTLREKLIPRCQPLVT